MTKRRRGPWRTLTAGEWVHTSMLSTRFGVDVPMVCEGCTKMTAGAAYFSVKRRVWRCTRCWQELGLA